MFWTELVLARGPLLRRHPEQAKQYEAVKVALVEQKAVDRIGYMDGKAPFIDRLMDLAKAWAETDPHAHDVERMRN